MFDVLLEKYINAMRSRLPAITYVQLSILVVGIILIAIASFVTSIKMKLSLGITIQIYQVLLFYLLNFGLKKIMSMI